MGYLVTFYFIVMDFFTGLLKAFATDCFSSKVMRKGLFHKVSLLCVLMLGFLMDYAQRFVELGVAVPVGAAACVYIVLMETGSTLENLCVANPELMPDKLCEMFGVNPSVTGSAASPVRGGERATASPFDLVPPERGEAPKAQGGREVAPVGESEPEQTDTYKLNRRE